MNSHCISDVVDHTWLQNASKAPNVNLGETVRARLQQLSGMNKLKKKALRVRDRSVHVCSDHSPTLLRACNF